MELFRVLVLIVEMSPVVHLLGASAIAIGPLLLLSEAETHGMRLGGVVTEIVTMLIVKVVSMILPPVLNSILLDLLLSVMASVVALGPRLTYPSVLLLTFLSISGSVTMMLGQLDGGGLSEQKCNNN